MAAGRIDFTREGVVAGWSPVDDVVMGGVSSSRLVELGADGACFEGVISLEQGGGFASVRSPAGAIDLTGAAAIRLDCRGDDRTYQVRLRTDDERDGVVWRARFEAPAAWESVRLRIADFEPTHRGRVVSVLVPLDPAAVRTIGLMLSDRQAGAFRLELRAIEAE